MWSLIAPGVCLDFKPVYWLLGGEQKEAGTLWEFVFGIDASSALPQEVYHTADFQQNIH